MVQLGEYLDGLQTGMREGVGLVEALERAEIFYEEQNKEAVLVANVRLAYIFTIDYNYQQLGH